MGNTLQCATHLHLRVICLANHAGEGTRGFYRNTFLALSAAFIFAHGFVEPEPVAALPVWFDCGLKADLADDY